MLLFIELVMLIDDAISLLSNFRLLSLIKRRVVVLVEVVKRLIIVRSRGGHLSGGNKEPVLRLTERILAL